jgi:hypothetical protein
MENVFHNIAGEGVTSHGRLKNSRLKPAAQAEPEIEVEILGRNLPLQTP